jgi:hypothetical protein
MTHLLKRKPTQKSDLGSASPLALGIASPTLEPNHAF